jgi:trehalose 6-phosphate synthase
LTPLRDGMNLVAKEFIAAQDPEDPGVLILSRFAGAAIDCRRALLVNPYDPESVAGAIATALAMPLAERRARHKDLLARVTENDIDKWQRAYLAALQGENGMADAPSSLALPPCAPRSSRPAALYPKKDPGALETPR